MSEFVARLVLVLSLVFPGAAFATGDGGEGGTTGYNSYGSGSKAKSASKGVSAQLTRKVARTIEGGGKKCLKLPKVYRYDCYRVVYGQARALIKGNKGYGDAYRALGKVQSLLAREVRRNTDRTAPKLKQGQQTFTPVTPQAAPKIKAKAVVALEQAETTLLRSSSQKGVHYARIAEAIGSNKVLLRAAMRLIPGLAPLFGRLA